jgi:serine/threonine protein kinase
VLHYASKCAALLVQLFDNRCHLAQTTDDAAEAAKDCERRTLMAIVQQPVSFESSAAQQLSAAARSVIERLLKKDPALRLGSRRGAGELKRHPFFEPVHWALLAHSKPPLVLTATATADSGSCGTGSVSVDDVALAELQSAVHKSWTWDAFEDIDSSHAVALSSNSAVAGASSNAAKQTSGSCNDNGSSSGRVGTNSKARHTSDGFAAYDFCADEGEISNVGPNSTAGNSAA